jgi:hypothetical protein
MFVNLKSIIDSLAIQFIQDINHVIWIDNIIYLQSVIKPFDF